ncbi:hypothetical protein CA13_59530 [Planctomycetes bacterium CA13]|uniref:DUF4350 domain-containing protein n=1 Tax=Novipirellula herctigrandis TaxID=2527986 RepID=A0A5C5ZAZ0_9BACT|nr:hypothetical protein CA13_59530 [Planctomycetes bacterium CA13]
MRFTLLLALLCVPLIVGCQGCRDESADAEKEKNKIPIQDFSSAPAQTFPDDQGVIGGAIKPGHWFTASQSLKSNKEDRRGELESHIDVVTGLSFGRPINDSSDGANVESDDTNKSIQGRVANLRPVTLPKGQGRRFDYRILAPRVGTTNARSRLRSSFVASDRSSTYETLSQPFDTLSYEEYFFVILTTRPERFAKLQVADWRKPFRSELEFDNQSANYRIVIPQSGELLPLSETMLDWTSTAVVLWDDISSDALTPGQFQAINDWVRFGGQLLVNGSDASEAIANSTLHDVLPLDPKGNVELDSDAGSELLSNWSVASDRSTQKQIALLRSQSGRIAIDGSLARDAKPIESTGGLILSRQLGRGRVVQSRFDLTSDWFTNWQSFDSFFNAVMLDRPRRKLIATSEMEMPTHQYPDLGIADAVPTINSKFRLFSRDSLIYSPDADADADATKRDETKRDATTTVRSNLDPFTRSDPVTGTSGWGGYSDASEIFKRILRSESGIEIPRSRLVIWSLGYYLIALVPLNYLLFRLIGRLEYAWMAVPVISIVGAVWVAHTARLDIGFARSQTEIAILETQADYPRAHLSRMVAIYNSLSSTYEFQFKTVDAVADVIPDKAKANDAPTMVFRTDFEEGPSLSGVAVGSNQTQLVRTEQVVDLGGGIYRSGDDLINESDYEFLEAIVVERDAASKSSVAVVGTVSAGSKTKMRFSSDRRVKVPSDLPLQTTELMSRLLRAESMPPSSSRMVARIDASVPGMTVVPSANQVNAQTVVISHLQHPPFQKRQADVNLITDFRSEDRL